MGVEMELREIESAQQFVSPYLRDKASKSSKAQVTRHYAALSHGQEIAFVAIDVPKDKSCLYIYTLFIEPALRCRGFGAEIVKECQAFAVKLGCKKIRVKPLPIEEGGSEDRLIAWYTRLGFKPSSQQLGFYEIILH
jgi:N-acetylglutamate synthase-like GNAT family acetyltransferase